MISKQYKIRLYFQIDICLFFSLFIMSKAFLFKFQKQFCFRPAKCHICCCQRCLCCRFGCFSCGCLGCGSQSVGRVGRVSRKQAAAKVIDWQKVALDRRPQVVLKQISIQFGKLPHHAVPCHSLLKAHYGLLFSIADISVDYTHKYKSSKQNYPSSM